MSKILPQIQKLIDNEGIKITSLERKIGASKGVLSRALQNNTDIQAKWVSKIVENYPRYSAEWLLTGIGPMLRHKELINKDNAIVMAFGAVPLIPIEAIAGYTSIDEPGVTYEDCDQYVIPEFDRIGVEFVIRVSGSSMYPKYSNGDLLACRKIKEVLFFQWGKVYVIDSSQGQLVKRVFEDKTNPDNIMLVSDNKDNYPAFALPKIDIRSLSIVVGVIRVE